MNILYRRPLGALIITALSVFVLYAYTDITLIKIFLALLFAFSLVALFILGFIKKRRFSFLKFSALFLLITIVFCNFYFDFWHKPYNRFSGDGEIVGTVTEIDSSKIYRYGVTVETDSINSAAFSKYKLKFDIHPELATDFTVGSKISFKASLAEFESYSDTFDSEQYYFSNGYNAYAESVTDITVIEHTKGTLSTKLEKSRTFLTRRAIYLSDENAGSLLGALLLGEKEELSPQMRLDFTRSGLAHILALSGMHLAILGLGVEKLFALFGLGKRARKILLIIFVLAYMFFTGLPISVVRAGLMLIIASLLFLFTGSKDTLTNLLLAVFIICLIMPYSVYSLSLWLSAFATLGIVILSELQGKNAKKRCNILVRFSKWCITALLSSIFAIGATLFITVGNEFGISLTSIITTPLFSILAEVYLYLGPLVLIFGDIVPIGKLLSLLGAFFEDCVSLTSSLKFAYVSSDFITVKILVAVFTVLFFSFVLLKIKRKKLYLTAVGSFFISIYAISAILTLASVKNDAAIYYSDNSGDKILAVSDYEAMICDNSSYSESSANGVVFCLKDSKIMYLDKYIVTHYSKNLAENILKIYRNVKIEKIYLPLPENEDEKAIAEEIECAFEDFTCEVLFYASNVPISTGETVYERTYNTRYGEGSAKCAFTLKYGNGSLLYLSSGMMEDKTKAKATEYMAESTAVIFGCYGKSYSKIHYFDEEFENLGFVGISSNNLALRPDTLKYYDAMGTTVEMHPRKHVLYIE